MASVGGIPGLGHQPKAGTWHIQVFLPGTRMATDPMGSSVPSGRTLGGEDHEHWEHGQAPLECSFRASKDPGREDPRTRPMYPTGVSLDLLKPGNTDVKAETGYDEVHNLDGGEYYQQGHVLVLPCPGRHRLIPER